MALIKADFVSESLMRTVSFQAILPVDKLGQEKTNQPFKTLYLLHGVFGNDTDWVSGTRIQRWAEERNLAVIMPSGENKFYVDNPVSQEFFSKFIGEELVEVTRRMFPLSTKREDTFIAGLSMGGYGALTNGLKYSETFGSIATLSAALLLDDFVNATDGDDVPYLNKRCYLESILGDLTQLKGSDKDYKALLLDLKNTGKDIPDLYMCVGKDDFVLEVNRDYHQFLLDNDVDHKYVEGEGAHEWDFWDRNIKDILEWLPLGEKSQGINSGNVK